MKKLIPLATSLILLAMIIVMPQPAFASHCAGLDLTDPDDIAKCNAKVGQQFCNGDTIYQNGNPATGITSQHSVVQACGIGNTCTTANGTPECVPKGALPSTAGPIGGQCEYFESHPDGVYICRGILRGTAGNPVCQYDPNTPPACSKATSGGTVDSIFGKVQAPAFVSSIGFGAAGLSTFLGNILKLLYMAGILIFVFMIVLSAVQWIASGGDKEAVGKARSRLTTAIIGVTLLALAGLLINILGRILGFTFFS